MYPAESRHRTLVALTTERADSDPDCPNYIFLEDGELRESRLTFGQLSVRARALGAALQAHGAAGQRVFLAFPPGLDFITAFFGCLHGGAVAVPLPSVSRPLSRAIYRIRSIANDARPGAILTSSELLPLVQSIREQIPELGELPLLCVDRIEDHEAAAWSAPTTSPGDLAFLQYTSGSTSLPKGVMVTQGSIVLNAAFYHAGLGHDASTVAVTWMPSFHDMGLMDAVIRPLFGGYRSIILSPTSFLQRPMRWLDALSRYRATFTGGPNFSFELCIRKSYSREELPERLDLSSVGAVLNAAEPVRKDTMERFAEHFAATGFRIESFCPGFGLAEATLKVTARRPGPGLFRHLSIRRAALERGSIELAGAEEGPGVALTVVGCGTAASPEWDTEAVIVEPETRLRCERGRVGEVWVRGPSLAVGYFDHPDATREVFDARLADDSSHRFMRTGDLGFIHEGELYITGRRKDLIIVNGRNVYPQDLERTAEEVGGEDLRSGCSAAFSIRTPTQEEAVVLVAEARAGRSAELSKLVDDIRHRVMELHEVVLHEIVILKPNSVLKTSSGKIRRAACRDAFLAGALPQV